MLAETEPVAKYADIWNFLNHEYACYNVSDPSVFEKFLIPDDHPVKIKLDRIFESVKVSNNLMQGLLDQCYYEPNLNRDIKVIKNADKRFTLRIDDPSFYMKGVYMTELAKIRGKFQHRPPSVEDFFEVPYSVIMRDSIYAYNLQDEIIIPKRYYYHIPYYSKEINPVNYMTLEEVVELMEDGPKITTLDPEVLNEPDKFVQMTHKLHQFRRIIGSGPEFQDIQLDKEGKKFVVTSMKFCHENAKLAKYFKQTEKRLFPSVYL